MLRSVRSPEFVARVVEAARQARAALPSVYQGDDSPFAAADAAAAFAELRKHARPGRTFLEWGSGIGTMTVLASLLGCDAYGIEIDPLLVAAARRLAEDLRAAAIFAEGNCLPVHAKPAADVGQPGRFVPGGPDGYLAIGRTLDDFDLVYVFPWPDQLEYCREIFARHAPIGARLLVFSQTMGMLETIRNANGCPPLRPA